MTFVIAFLLIFISTVNDGIGAQQSNSSRGSITINTDLVATWAQILDSKNGKSITGLGVDDLILREEGKPQQISLVKEGQPISIVILVDGKVCIWPPELEFQRHHQALYQLGDDAEIALMAWDSDVALVQPITTDKDAIYGPLGNRVSFFRALNGPENIPRPERTWYRPGEAIYQAAEYLKKNASLGRRKIILLIAWFRPPLRMAETHPRKANEVIELLEETGTTVYGLYLTDEDERSYRLLPELPFSSEKTRRRSGGTLEQFVELTGGSILVGERKEADQLLMKLASLIRSSYTIGYYPENSTFDGRFRRISLELSSQGKTKAGKVNIKTRNGYLALRLAPTTAAENKPER